MGTKQRLMHSVVRQFHEPTGPAGHVAGWVMSRRSSNVQRNRWAVKLLDVQPTDHVIELGCGPGVAIARNGPGPLVRALGRAVNYAVVRFPWSWRLLRGPVRRFFNSVAVGWDERVRSDSPEYLLPLQAALDRLQVRPARILDIGTGTGAAALELADRYPDAEIVGIDVSDEMVAQARARAADLGGRVRFLVADIASFEEDEGFDLIAMLNMPPFFDKVVAVLRPGGLVVNASSYGARTPFYTPPWLLERGFERRGLRTIASEQAGRGTYYLAERG